MKALLFAMVVAGALITHGLAQQAAPPPQPPGEEVLGQRLIQELNRSIACETREAANRRHIADLEAEVTRLQEKYEPKKVEPPKK